MGDKPRARPPRDNLYRATRDFELREERAGDLEEAGPGRLVGHFAVFNQWTEINSQVEGRFLERVAPGAFKKTFAENRDAIRVLFNHGKDPSIGDKVLGPIDILEEDETGARYEVPLLDTSYNRDLAPGLRLRRNGYGSSFRFSVVREDFPQARRDATGRYPDYNPEGLPERTIRELRLYEFGPVTFPAYANATAAVRSMTDEFTFDHLTQDPARLRELIDFAAQPSVDAGAEPHLEPEPEPPPERATSSPTGPADAGPLHEEPPTVENITVDEKRARDREITDELTRTASEYTGVLPADVQARWDSLVAEQDALRADIAAVEAREARVRDAAERRPTVPGSTTYTPPAIVARMSESDIFDQRWTRETSPERRDQVLRDDAMRAAEQATYPHAVDKMDAAGQLASLLDHRDSPNKELARRVLATGSPLYRRAFNKYITGQYMTPEEQRGTALAVQVDATGGFLLPFAFDPSIIRIGAHATNPYRAVCRVEQIVGTDTWLGLTSTAVVATRADEAAAATEQGPTFAQPSVLVTKVQGAITYSIETGEDRPDLGAEMAGLIAEARDNEEETAFSTGVGGAIGSKVAPIGFFAAHGTSGAYTHINLATAHTWAIGDVDATEAALPIRHRANAVWIMARPTLRTIQGLETTGGRLFGGTYYPAAGVPASKGSGYTGLKLLGYDVYEAPSATYDVTVDDTPLLWLGDPRSYVIVDRVGINVEYIPHVFADAAGSLPTGQRRLYFYYRNSGKPINVDAGRILMVLNA